MPRACRHPVPLPPLLPPLPESISCPALRVPEPPSQTLPRASGSARIALKRVRWPASWALTTPEPNALCTQFRTAAPRACPSRPNSSSPCILSHPLRSWLWSRFIRTPSPLPRAELPLPIPLRRSSSGSPTLDLTLPGRARTCINRAIAANNHGC
jgi:hypothetical protein